MVTDRSPRLFPHRELLTSRRKTPLRSTILFQPLFIEKKEMKISYRQKTTSFLNKVYSAKVVFNLLKKEYVRLQLDIHWNVFSESWDLKLQKVNFRPYYEIWRVYLWHSKVFYKCYNMFISWFFYFIYSIELFIQKKGFSC